MGRGGRKCKQVLDEFQKTRGYYKFEEEAIRSYYVKTAFWKGRGELLTGV
jgi:hypothetical protein